MECIGVCAEVMQTFQFALERMHTILQNKPLRTFVSPRTDIAPSWFSGHLQSMRPNRKKYFFNFLKNKNPKNIFLFFSKIC
jgi:hypothetical protein